MTRLLLMIALAFATSVSQAQELSKKQQSAYEKAVRFHMTNPDCAMGGQEPLFKEFIQHENDTSLILVSCEIGSWQVNWMAYAAFFEEDETTISQLFFPLTDGKHWTAENRIHMPEWDEDKRVLKTTDMGDRDGTCGSISTYKWQQNAFYLTTTRFKECREGGDNTADDIPNDEENWPLVFMMKE